jgi:hypothetical protein
MKNNIAKALDTLKTTDVMSLVLFALYKIKDIPEYATLSELVYLLDEKSLNNFLEYYGGTTIRVPTKHELMIVINTLLLYEFTKLDNMSFQEACKHLSNTQNLSQKELKDTYQKLVEVLDKYDFRRN